MSRERADARRYRDAVLDAAAAELRAGRALKVQRVAAAAGVSRSTIYRHFQDPDGLERAIVEAALQQAQEAAERAIRQTRAPLANARAAVIGLSRWELTTDLPPLIPPRSSRDALRSPSSWSPQGAAS